MHEVGICGSIVAAVAEKAGGRPVTAVVVRIGEQLQASDAAMSLAFRQLTQGTNLEDAELRLRHVPMEGTCRDCGSHDIQVDRWNECAACGSVVVDVSDGDDLVLEAVHYRPSPGSRD